MQMQDQQQLIKDMKSTKENINELKSLYNALVVKHKALVAVQTDPSPSFAD